MPDIFVKFQKCPGLPFQGNNWHVTNENRRYLRKSIPVMTEVTSRPERNKCVNWVICEVCRSLKHHGRFKVINAAWYQAGLQRRRKDASLLFMNDITRRREWSHPSGTNIERIGYILKTTWGQYSTLEHDGEMTMCNIIQQPRDDYDALTLCHSLAFTIQHHWHWSRQTG